MSTETLDINKLSQWYETNKAPFIRFIGKHYDTLKSDDIEDLYQESIMALYQNIRTNKLTELKCSLSTYLIRIGMNKANSLLKQIQPVSEDQNDFNWDSLSHLTGDDTHPYQKEIYDVVNGIEQPCREILFGYYYDSFSMTTIAERLGYKDADTVKATKYRCMQKVKNMLHTRINYQKQKAAK